MDKKSFIDKILNGDDLIKKCRVIPLIKNDIILRNILFYDKDKYVRNEAALNIKNDSMIEEIIYSNRFKNDINILR